MQEKKPKQQQQEQQLQQNQHQTTTTQPTKLRPKKRTQQKLRFNYEARNSATGSQRVQQPKSSTMAEKLKAQLWLHSRPKKGNFTKERKGEGKKNHKLLSSKHPTTPTTTTSTCHTPFLLPLLPSCYHHHKQKPMKVKMMITSSQTHN